MALKESDVNWFRPLWRRMLVTAVCAAWLGFELIVSHDELWMGISGVALAYCVWNFFLRFPKDAPSAAPAPTKPPEQP